MPALRRTRLLLVAALALAACQAPGGGSARPWLDASIAAGRWLEALAIPTDAGLAWPAVPAEGGAGEPSLYTGSPGVVLFYLELAAATRDEHWTALARRGADELLARLPQAVKGEAAGLYTGLAGTGFTLGEAWLCTHDERYRAGLQHSVDVLGDSARTDPQLPGSAWGATNDVIAGTAGIGLFLAWAGEVLDSERARELARLAAARLEVLAEPATGGLDWPMDPDFPRRMPNFSHGTAGIAMFLARMGRTGAALQGAEHLLAIADRSEGLRLHHDTPDGTALFYYGWCHGPCGTARLFQELERRTRAPRWKELELECARAVLASGLPEQRLPGFWNNVSRCCGSAGVIEFFLDLHARAGEPRFLAFAQRVARDLVARATPSEGGLCWLQAEHRSRPELLQAQTGLMQGAAGIGLALLHLDAAERGRKPALRLPDE